MLFRSEPTPASDVYAVGALLYELVALRPVDPAVPLSTLAPGAGAALDVLIDDCLAPRPHERLDNLLALRAGLAAIVGPLAEVLRDDDDDIPVEVSDPSAAAGGYTIPPGEFNFDDDGGEPAVVARGEGLGVHRGAHPIAPMVSVPPAADADLGTLLKIGRAHV